jgi:hypothetical protein
VTSKITEKGKAMGKVRVKLEEVDVSRICQGLDIPSAGSLDSNHGLRRFTPFKLAHTALHTQGDGRNSRDKENPERRKQNLKQLGLHINVNRCH